MKKYILKQDLPLAKAGTIVQVDLGKSFPRIYENKERNFKIIGVVERGNMDEWLEEFIEKPNSVWDLKIGDKYYTFSSYDKKITEYPWSNYGFDIYTRDLGNAFHTEEEAEKELQKRKAIQKIKKYCWENNIDTEYDEERNDKLFYIEIDGEFEGQINADSFPPVFSPIGYFSHENAQKILDNFEEELKIILE